MMGMSWGNSAAVSFPAPTAQPSSKLALLRECDVCVMVLPCGNSANLATEHRWLDGPK